MRAENILDSLMVAVRATVVNRRDDVAGGKNRRRVNSEPIRDAEPARVDKRLHRQDIILRDRLVARHLPQDLKVGAFGEDGLEGAGHGVGVVLGVDEEAAEVDEHGRRAREPSRQLRVLLGRRHRVYHDRPRARHVGRHEVQRDARLREVLRDPGHVVRARYRDGVLDPALREVRPRLLEPWPRHCAVDQPHRHVDVLWDLPPG